MTFLLYKHSFQKASILRTNILLMAYHCQKSSITLHHQTLMKEARDPRSEASFGESKLGERLIDLSKRYVCSVILIPGNLYYKHLILQNISKP